MKVFLDLDGVLTDFISGICRAHNRENPYLEKGNTGLYALESIWGMDPEEFWAPTHHPEFWSELDWMDDGREILDAVTHLVGNDHVYLLSSASSPAAASGKVAWIKKHLKSLNQQYLLGPPKYACAAVDSVLIDDWDINTTMFNRYGGHGILIPRPWNTRHKQVGKGATDIIKTELTLAIYDIQTYYINCVIQGIKTRRMIQ